MAIDEQPPAAASGPGRDRQGAIYRQGALGRRPAVPTDFAELEQRARRASSAARLGATSPAARARARTMRNNRRAFDRWAIVPRMAHGITTRDLTTTVLGTKLASPLLLAPVGAGALLARGQRPQDRPGGGGHRRAVRLLQPGLQLDGGLAAAMGDTPAGCSCTGAPTSDSSTA